ncbi:MAG: DUF5803 family protein [Haloarculaceae archaeon]
MKRRALALGLLAVLVVLAGCSAGEPDPQQLNANATYDWSGNVTARITVNTSTFTAVYRLDEHNGSTVEAYSRDALGTEAPLRISGLRYRYPNGTVVTTANSTMSATVENRRTVVHLPVNGSGQLAFTASRHGKSFGLPVFVEGSYDVALPRGARVGLPLLSQVSPPGWSGSVHGARQTVHWDSVDARSLSLRWYLQRDLLLFATLLAGLLVVGSGGAFYYYRQIKRLERQRDEVGLDVDTEDDDLGDGGPPPGMR